MKTILFAFLTVSIAFLASCNKKNEPENSDAPQNDEASGTVKDICGNTYKYVKIGEQYWMAENMRCNKYDTQSERKGASVSTSDKETFTPYYTNASDINNWLSTKYSGNLTEKQISLLGYLYNWAAAVGVEDGEKQTSGFSGKRQGVCPNGWHIPTTADWDRLEDQINSNAKHLKATSGWYEDGNGLDTCGFSALPSSFANGSQVRNIGYSACFWEDKQYNAKEAYEHRLDYNVWYLIPYYAPKYVAQSVRCVKN